MKIIITALVAAACMSFIFVFNVIGENWDMGGINPSLDIPSAAAFIAPEIYSGVNSPAIFFEGREIVLSAAAFGGNIKYQWYLNGDYIPNATENILLIFGAQVENSGVYSLQATNDLGVSELHIDVVIHPKEKAIDDNRKSPEIIYSSGGGRGLIGLPYTLAATATGENKKYQWFKNGRRITNANSYRLFFNELKRTDSGTYEIKVTNENGSSVEKMYIHADRENSDQEG